MAKDNDFMQIVAMWVLAGLIICVAISVDRVRVRIDRLESYHTEEVESGADSPSAE